ncbi:hypothetical protein VM98_35185 [Streptomyces rubellomurinus subsp. indigoferus]|nr:hypothetical protein VM98_35185 [Streptomyces rubellomurinus subsp. indigoferus]
MAGLCPDPPLPRSGGPGPGTFAPLITAPPAALDAAVARVTALGGRLAKQGGRGGGDGGGEVG